MRIDIRIALVGAVATAGSARLADLLERHGRQNTCANDFAPTIFVCQKCGEACGGENDDEGYVEFIAHYSANGQTVEHHEHSYFKRLDGEWKFIDGEIESGVPYVREEPKIGRNDPCPCGSGKKYKKCCGKGK